MRLSLVSFVQIDAAGQLVFNAQFPTGVNTYRAYLLPWKPAGNGDPGPHRQHAAHHPRRG